jgi:hypothetical protein
MQVRIDTASSTDHESNLQSRTSRIAHLPSGPGARHPLGPSPHASPAAGGASWWALDCSPTIPSTLHPRREPARPHLYPSCDRIPTTPRPAAYNRPRLLNKLSSL